MSTRTVYFFGGVHPIHESIVRYPPDGYRMVSNVSLSSFSKIGEYSNRNVMIKRLASGIYAAMQHPRMTIVGKKCDLIHTSSGVFALNNKPHVVSVEYYSSFAGLKHDKALQGGFYRSTLRHLLSRHCKKILPFSKAACKSIISGFGSDSRHFEHKLEVLYPSIDLKRRTVRERDGPFRVLHIGSGFFEKGGRQLFKAVEILNERYGANVEIFSITNPAPHYQDEFDKFVGRYSKKKEFHILNTGITREILFDEFYGSADVFVMPSYGDFFGYVFLEAMACGLPVIGTDVFAMPEIIEDGKNGFLIHAPVSPFESNLLRKSNAGVDDYMAFIVKNEIGTVTEQLVDRLLLLIEDEARRRRMGQRSLEIVGKERFSVAESRARLKRIYDDALSR